MYEFFSSTQLFIQNFATELRWTCSYTLILRSYLLLREICVLFLGRLSSSFVKAISYLFIRDFNRFLEQNKNDDMMVMICDRIFNKN